MRAAITLAPDKAGVGNIKFYYLSTYNSQTPLVQPKFTCSKIGVFFLFLKENICCGYSYAAPWSGASNEYPQHVFFEKKRLGMCQYDTDAPA